MDRITKIKSVTLSFQVNPVQFLKSITILNSFKFLCPYVYNFLINYHNKYLSK